MIALFIGLSAGIAASLLRGKIFDRGIVAATVFSISLPEFWLALILIFVFAVTLRWFPVAGYVTFDEGIWASLATLALPALAIGIRQAALLTRMTRSAMLDVLDEPYVTTARAQGLPESTVIGRYTLRTAAVPVVTVVGLAVSYLLSGAVAIEIIFSLPGMGKLLVDAVSRRDYPVVEGAVLTIAIILVIVNLAVDLLYALLDPRIRLK
jgi:peptide/nickel transport system permease protein